MAELYGWPTVAAEAGIAALPGDAVRYAVQSSLRLALSSLRPALGCWRFFAAAFTLAPRECILAPKVATAGQIAEGWRVRLRQARVGLS